MVVVHSLWGCLHVNWCYLGSIRAFEGILLMWDRRVVKKTKCVGAYSVACSFRNDDDNFEWIFAGVYGSNVDNVRRVLWDELAGLIN
jgi:hypothetical protein